MHRVAMGVRFTTGLKGLLAGAAAALALASPVTAHHDLYSKVSNGNGAGSSAIDAYYNGTSADGKRVFFTTMEKMTVDDNDSQMDVYERSFGVTKRISTGPVNGNGAYQASFNAASTDGTRVVFSTAERLVAADQDSATDVYMRDGSTTKLVSVGSGVNNAAAIYSGASADLSHVYFSTSEKIGAFDTDNQNDVYQWVNGAVGRVSQGPAGGNGGYGAAFLHVSAGGTRVLFYTAEKLTADDTDNQVDIYERSNNQTVRISKGGATNGNGAFPAIYAGATPSGAHVFFTSTEKLAATDGDNQVDLFDNNNGTVTQVSRGQINGNGFFPVTFGGMSDDGSKVFFMTSENLISADVDTATDVYMRFGGVTSRISTGQINGNGAWGAVFAGASADGSHVFFMTSEMLVAADTDGQLDIYDRSNNTTSRVSAGAINGNGSLPAAFLGTSDDGSRVFFASAESLAQTDADNYVDIYERDGGTATFEVSTGFGAFDATFAGMTPDGRSVFFSTAERIVANDVDNNLDVYGAYER